MYNVLGLQYADDEEYFVSNWSFKPGQNPASAARAHHPGPAADGARDARALPLNRRGPVAGDDGGIVRGRCATRRSADLRLPHLRGARCPRRAPRTRSSMRSRRPASARGRSPARSPRRTPSSTALFPVIVGALLGVCAHYLRLRGAASRRPRWRAARAEALRMRLQKVERDQAVWVLAAAVLHELNNPLHALGLLLDEIDAGAAPTGDRPCRSSSTRARAQADRALPSPPRVAVDAQRLGEPELSGVALERVVGALAVDVGRSRPRTAWSCALECAGPCRRARTRLRAHHPREPRRQQHASLRDVARRARRGCDHHPRREPRASAQSSGSRTTARARSRGARRRSSSRSGRPRRRARSGLADRPGAGASDARRAVARRRRRQDVRLELPLGEPAVKGTVLLVEDEARHARAAGAGYRARRLSVRDRGGRAPRRSTSRRAVRVHRRRRDRHRASATTTAAACAC